MSNRKPYIKPQAMNLSGLGVVGTEFLGICAGGSNPTTYTCANGDRPQQTSMACQPTGFTPDIGGCKAGGNVANVCSIGSMHVG
jgi:hypothetical protein